MNEHISAVAQNSQASRSYYARPIQLSADGSVAKSSESLGRVPPNESSWYDYFLDVLPPFHMPRPPFCSGGFAFAEGAEPIRLFWLDRTHAQWFCRQVANLLAAGHRTLDVARRMGVTPGRISMIRRELARSWDQFHGVPSTPA